MRASPLVSVWPATAKLSPANSGRVRAKAKVSSSARSGAVSLSDALPNCTLRLTPGVVSPA